MQHVSPNMWNVSKWPAIKRSLQRKTSKLDQCQLHQNQSWSSCRFSEKKNDTVKRMWEPSYIFNFLAVSKCSCKSQAVQLQYVWLTIPRREFLPRTKNISLFMVKFQIIWQCMKIRIRKKWEKVTNMAIFAYEYYRIFILLFVKIVWSTKSWLGNYSCDVSKTLIL